MDQVSIKYANIFHWKTLQNLPKFRFLVWKQTIWQPCFDVPFRIEFPTNCLRRLLWTKNCYVIASTDKKV
jgi:hypothetical protein